MSREAMKLALEALEFADEFIEMEPFEHVAQESADAHKNLRQAITALKQALEQPEPETVQCHTCKGLGRIYMGCGSWIHCDTCNTTGKATTPPKREWVGLTEEEHTQIAVDAGCMSSDWVFYGEAVERALKNKNT